MNEKDFIEYMERCAIGKELYETNCIEGLNTHYFIMNHDIKSTCRMLKYLSSYRKYYSNNNPQNVFVNRIVAITTENVLPVVELCVEVDDTIVVFDYELECLNDYASVDTETFNTLFPYERHDDELFKDTFDVSSYPLQLRLPKNFLEIESKFKVSLNSISNSDNVIMENNITPDKTLIIIKSSENDDFLLDDSIWNELLDFAKENQFDIYTFTQNEDEVLLGTKPLDISIDVLFALSLRGCKIVSLQNYIIDVMRILNMQQPMALVLFNINNDTKNIADDLNLTSEINDYQNIRYICTNEETNQNASVLILEQFKIMTQHCFKLQQKEYLLGLKLANSYCINDPESHFIIINRHIGDSALYYSRLFKGYREYLASENTNRTVKKIIAITHQVLRGAVCLCLEVDDIIVLPKEQLKVLEKYSNLPNRVHQNLFCDANTFYNMSLWYGFHSNSTTLMLPINATENNNSSFSIPENSMKNAITFIENEKLEIEKTLILLPYALSSSRLELKDFQKLIDYTKQLGYRVFTNCSPTETPLVGTDKLVIPVDEFVALAHKGVAVVGVQCGLMDIFRLLDVKISAIHINAIHLFSDEFFANEIKLTEQITQRDNITHIKYNPTDEESLDDLILQEFKKKYIQISKDK